MKAKTASIIQKISETITYIIYLPFAIVGSLFGLVYLGCSKVKEWIELLNFDIGHKLFLLCDEKDVIKNKGFFVSFTAKALYQYLKTDECKRYKENEKVQDS